MKGTEQERRIALPVEHSGLSILEYYGRRKQRYALVYNVTAALLLFFFAVSLLFLAQVDMTRKKSGGWGPGSSYSKLFDPAKMETVRGAVVSLNDVVPMRGMARGMAITVRTEKGESVLVHLGPAWYLESQDVRIQVKDRVVVRGSRTTLEARPVLIAAEVRAEGKMILPLRDRNGRAAWSALVPVNRH